MPSPPEDNKSEALYTHFESAKIRTMGRPRYVVKSILRFERPLPAPSSAFLGGDPRMAALAQRHEVTIFMGTAVCQRNNVVYFLRRRDPALAPAYLA